MKWLNNVTSTVSKTFAKVKFQTVKHSPEILMVAGIVSLVGAGVLACRATLKTKNTVDNYKDDKEDIESTIRVPDEDGTMVPYGEEEKKTDLTKLKIKTGLTIVKDYAPTITLTILGVTSIVVSNNIMHKRALALATAYTALNTSFKNYRDRVVERYGEEVDKELKYGVKKSTIEQTTVNEKGKEKTEKVEVTTVDTNGDEYVRVFDSSNKFWDKNNDYIRIFLDSEESRANNLLRANGHVFLNDILKRLGFEETKMGQVIGWIYTPDKDCYIDFDIYQIEDDYKALLRFNPQGYILDKLEEESK